MLGFNYPLTHQMQLRFKPNSIAPAGTTENTNAATIAYVQTPATPTSASISLVAPSTIGTCSTGATISSIAGGNGHKKFVGHGGELPFALPFKPIYN
jgi:hypothetical protein